MVGILYCLVAKTVKLNLSWGQLSGKRGVKMVPTAHCWGRLTGSQTGARGCFVQMIVSGCVSPQKLAGYLLLTAEELPWGGNQMFVLIAGLTIVLVLLMTTLLYVLNRRSVIGRQIHLADAEKAYDKRQWG